MKKRTTIVLLVCMLATIAGAVSVTAAPKNVQIWKGYWGFEGEPEPVDTWKGWFYNDQFIIRAWWIGHTEKVTLTTVHYNRDTGNFYGTVEFRGTYGYFSGTEYHEDGYCNLNMDIHWNGNTWNNVWFLGMKV